MSNLLAMTVAGSTVVILMLLLRPMTAKFFRASWQYRIEKMAIAFFLLPISLFGGKLFSVIPQSVRPSQYSRTPPLTTQGVVGQNNLLNTMDAVIERHLTVEAIQMFSSIWIVGTIGFAVWHFYCYHRFMKLLQTNSIPTTENTIALLSSYKKELGIRCNVKLMQNPTITSPMLVGLVRPMILLPTANMPNIELKLILTHELTHLKRGDIWVKMLALIVGTIHWFNPFAYLLRKDIGRWSELSCDEVLVAQMTHEERRIYGETILNTLDNHSSINTAFCSSFCESQIYIKRRLTMLLNVKKTKKIISIFAVAATFTIGCTATAFAVSAWKSNVALNKVIASASSPHHGSVIEANKITDYNDGAFVADPSGISFNAYRELTDDSVYEGFTTDPSGVSFSSHKGSLDIKSDPSDFDMKKAIADIEAGLIQPLSKDNLPKGISQDSILTFTEQDDTIVSITLD